MNMVPSPIVDQAEAQLRAYGEHVAYAPMTREDAERLLPLWVHYREMSPREVAATLARFGQPSKIEKLESRRASGLYERLAVVLGGAS